LAQTTQKLQELLSDLSLLQGLRNRLQVNINADLSAIRGERKTMKINVYFGESSDFNYIVIVMGKKYIEYPDYINGIDICRKNIPAIVDSINFDEFDAIDFNDQFETIESNSYSDRRICGRFTVEEWLKWRNKLKKISKN